MTFATRVIPITGARRSTRLSVSLVLADLCVPRRNVFGVIPINRGYVNDSEAVGGDRASKNSFDNSELHARYEACGPDIIKNFFTIFTRSA